MIAALVLGSCAPAEAPTPAPPTTPSGPEMVTLKLTKVDGTAVEKTVEKPRYGGTFVGAFDRPHPGWDDCGGSNRSYYWVAYATHDEMLEGNYMRGPAGTNEAAWLIQGTLFIDLSRGTVIESWEFDPANDTATLHVRKGVHFHDKPPVNGRELDAYDIEESILRSFKYTKARIVSSDIWFESVEIPDKWTVVLKSKPGMIGQCFKNTTGEINIWPKEVIANDTVITDWRQSIGTGPYMVADDVPGSITTLERNPNYYNTDPLHPENRLPYPDGVKWLVIQDASTRLASLRTHKIDWIQRVRWEEAATLKKSNPELKYTTFFEAAHMNALDMRQDKEDLPFKDVRVRQALMLAIDNKAIVDEYWGGYAEIFSTPVAPYAELLQAHIPLEDMPKHVQELYEYHPDKAKQLLAEAGYPNGFETEVMCHSGHADYMAILASYWADIGVELKIDVKEYGVWMSTRKARAYNEMMASPYCTVACTAPLPEFDPLHWQNGSYVDDPVINPYLDIIMKNVVINDDAVWKALRDISPYIVEQVYYIEPPSPYYHCFWTPWVKQYNGEWTVGISQSHDFVRGIWIDQDLKEEMTGKR